jgi:hypothetical protein
LPEARLIGYPEDLDPARIPDGMSFLRGHLPDWGFLVDQAQAGEFRARATQEDKEELRSIAARFKEPDIARAYEA